MQYAIKYTSIVRRTELVICTCLIKPVYTGQCQMLEFKFIIYIEICNYKSGPKIMFKIKEITNMLERKAKNMEKKKLQMW